VLPNAKVGGEAIINFNRRGTRRWLTVGIGYKDSIGAAMAEIEAVRGRCAYPQDPPRRMDDVAGESSVDLVIRGWTTPDDFWVAQTDLPRHQVKPSTAPASPSRSQRELTVIQGSLPAAAERQS
jgi:small conductance mechanosensitive channel